MISIKFAHWIAKERAINFVRRLNIFEKNSTAESTVIGVVVTVFILAILASALLPTSINTLNNSRNASWSASILGVYDAIPIIILVTVLIAAIGIIREKL